MSWRDRMRQGSFRGVPFYTKGTDDDQGRFATVHQVFASGDSPRGIPDDTGAMLGRHSLDVFVGGEDYDEDLKRLEDALGTAGPGELVHPFRGSMRVTIVGGFKTSQGAIDGGGFARVSFLAVRCEESGGLRTRTLPTTATRLASKAATTSAAADFAEKFSVADLPSAYHLSASEALGAVGTALAEFEGKIAGSTGVLADGLSGVAGLMDQAATMLAAPSSLATAVVDAVAAVFDSARAVAASARELAKVDPIASVRQLLTLARSLLRGAHGIFDLPELIVPLGTVTTNRTREAANIQALRTLVLGAVVAETASTLTWTPYASRAGALDALGDLLGMFDSVELEAGDGLFRSLDALRSTTSAYLKGVARTLPEVTTYTPGTWTHAVLIAHELYGDATRADEVAARNGIVHSGMIPPGVPLEVLVG